MPDNSLPREQFFRDYVDALDEGKAAMFVGAGVSTPAGFVDWRGLLQEFADELGLDLDVEHDLVTVAQYHLNANASDRSRLNQRIVNEFNKKASPTASHLALARLPINIFWTSNFDPLLETCLRGSGKHVDVKVGDDTLTTSAPGAQATVYKLHGDVASPSSIIIARDDYEDYATTHPGFQTALRAHLSGNTFLFLGFSFTDPNMEYIFAQVRAAFRSNQRTHYAIFRRDKRSAYFESRQQLRIADLKRYGVHVVLLDEYSEIPELLAELNARYLRRSVMVSGAAADFNPFGQARLESLCRRIGQVLIADDYNVVSGFGLGVGGPVILGSVEELYRSGDPQMGQRLKLFPFPQQPPEGMTQAAFYTRYRRDMIAQAGFLVVVSGNRVARDGAGGTEPSPGVREEVEIGKAGGKYIVPIGATGWTAREVWDECMRDFDAVYPVGTPRDALGSLGDESNSDQELVASMMTLIKHLTPKA